MKQQVLRSLFMGILIIVTLISGVMLNNAHAAYTPPTVTTPLATPDYFGFANYANSPLPKGAITAISLADGGEGYSNYPVITVSDFNCSGAGCGSGATATATVTNGVITRITLANGGSNYFAPVVTIIDTTGRGASATASIGPTSAAPAPALTGGIRKFVDTLPGLCPVSGPNTVQQCIPLAAPDTTSFPGSDYYRLGLKDYSQKLHTDLPATKLRGYLQLDAVNNPVKLSGAAAPNQYLGPLILATKNRPVRVKFTNLLGTGNAGDLFIPTDTTYMGAGMGPLGAAGGYYTQNRATLHLHGGNTPWISDGTAHQWVTPRGETSTTYLKGASFQNVPDMVNGSGTACAGTTGSCFTPRTNDGIGTFYWTNQQSGRLMFYHDHALGMTRLNAYAGEAAGYLLVDPVEETTLQNATVPGTIITDPTTGAITSADLAHLIPLVIQDKGFVPPPEQLKSQDPTWSTALYGSTGSLWFPHVYMPNQNPMGPDGSNAFGRWDYGPWFWPPQTTLTAAIPNTAVTVPCNSIANPGVQLVCPIIPNPSGTPEGFMDTPLVNGTAYPVLHVAPEAYRFRILSAGNDRTWHLSFFTADPTITSGPGVGKEVKMVPADTTPASLCSQVTPISQPALNAGMATGLLDPVSGKPLNNTGLPTGCYPTSWPTDGRDGGVPDPATAGPAWVQIGTEGGLLPAPVVIPPTPVGFEYGRRSITVLSIGVHGLLLGPAERADVIVDFSAYAGKTLILYNDAPAPVPAFDARIDYYTNSPDQVTSGGSPPTLPGYGPNTRTIMQVVVDGTPSNTTPFNLNTLKAALPGLFKTSLDTPIVPETAYNPVYNPVPNFTDKYTNIQDTTITFTPVGGSAPTTYTMNPKTIQELFTLDYGRMNATLGTEVPTVNFTNQTTVPLGFADPATEILTDGETQIWKLTHNGVDTHFIHFHLFNVQVLNRMGWDGSVRPPDANEMGWKDTVRMNPLEDITFAMKAVKQNLPFRIPNSNRVLDVTLPVNATFQSLDPLTGGAVTVVNAVTNFGWEYTWHCHILGHEENDMMRPIIFQVPTVIPPAPVLATAVPAIQKVTLTWTMTATTPANGLVGYRIQRAPNNAGVAGTYTTIATINSTLINTYDDTTVAPTTTYWYRVVAFNGVGQSLPSNALRATTTTWSGPTVLTLTPDATSPHQQGSAVVFTAAASGASPGVTFQYRFWLNNGTSTVLVQDYSYNQTWTLPGTTPVGTYVITVDTSIDGGATVAATTPVLYQIIAYVPPTIAGYIPPTVKTPLATPDYFGFANYANSPLPKGAITDISLGDRGEGYSNIPVITITDFNCTPPGCGSGATATATVSAGEITNITLTNGGGNYFAPVVTISDATGHGASATATIGPTPSNPAPSLTGGIRKFVNNLPGLCLFGRNNINQCIPLAEPDTAAYPGSDYYRLGLMDYTEQLHSDLPPTRLRGYLQLDAGSNPKTLTGSPAPNQYLGPLILATKGRPVRVKFTNLLGTGNAGDLFIPTDTTYMGAEFGPLGAAGGYYTQNRATLHLHGGNTPWISDGTAHTWITPRGETSTTYLKGDSFQNVPDMVNGTSTPCASPTGECFTPANNDGVATYFWTNQQGGRLMFYHDHALGTTRLDAYAGEAAGYLLVDPLEETALKNATAPGTIVTDPASGAIVSADLTHLVPLVIQDKGFVPPPEQLNAQDPTWSTALYGGTGNLWFPHVYMPNQNPMGPDGANAFGRWDYGPWFFPPLTTLSAATPSTAVTVPCSSIAYPGVQLACPITPNPSGTPESFMDTPLVNGTAYPVLHVAPSAYRFKILAAGNDRTWHLSLFTADPTITSGPGVGKEVKMVPAAVDASQVCSLTTQISQPALNAGLATASLDPVTGKPLNGTGLPSGCYPTSWPTDGRPEGVPDPATAGPAWVQIGTEGGLLPAPVVIPPTALGYEYGRRSITVLNIGVHGLLLGPAERADVIVDFSAFAGKTLILYNDAPAPVPAFDTRIDFYTNSPDQVTSGGAPPTLPGYGPNTRTIMQIVVDGSDPNTVPFDLNALKAAFNTVGTTPGIYAATQEQPIVPESVYNSAFNASYTDKYTSIQDTTITFTPVSTPAGENPVQFFNMKPKTIQELFTLDYGRMNATLGTELPNNNFLTQTTVPLGFAEPATEIFTDGETQIWKLTHNGVDTHFIHFHLFNVQVLNRMGWDGTVRPPDANEVGWKDTVRMNPLEDITFAMKAVKQIIPFSIPDSIRVLSPTLPVGAIFQGLDPLTGAVVNIPNVATNFGWEYTWHCHILGHEENDMMRPTILNVPTVVPPAPTLTTAVPAIQQVVLTWSEPATVSSNSVVGFHVQRALDNAGLPGAFATIATINDTTTTIYTDATVSSDNAYWYRIVAFNGIGSSTPSNMLQAVTNIWFDGTGVTLTPALTSPQAIGTTILFTAAGSGASTGVTYQYRFWLNNGSGNVLVQDYSPNPQWALTTTTPGNYTVTVDVRTFFGSTTPAASTSVNYVVTPLVLTYTVNNPLAGTLQGPTVQIVQAGATAATVTAVANTGYTFVNWTAPPSAFSSASAALTVINVTAIGQYIANFVQETAFRIGTTYFNSLQEAYNAAVTGDTIQVYDGVQTGTLLANRPIAVTVSGGWNVGYTANTGMTTIFEKMSLQQGRVNVKNLNVKSLNRPVITTNQLPGYTIGSGAYNATIIATAGVFPYTFTVSSGSLPAGLTLSPTGDLTGSPATPGTYSFTVTVTDSAGVPLSNSMAFVLDIIQPATLAITTTSPLASYTIGTGPYSATIAASGGIPTYSYTVTAGALPVELTLAANGQISGTPATPGAYDFTVTATDSTQPTATTASQAFQLVVIQPAALAITTTSPLASYTIGTGPYSSAIAASGGIPTYTYTVTAGALPVELTLAANGQISGTPATPGTYDFTVTVTDSTQPTAATVSQAFQLVVIQPAALAITTASPLASYTIGTGPYSSTIAASGGIPTYTYAVTAGALPVELTLATNGQITGTPATPGTYNFTVMVTDSTKPTAVTASQTFQLVVIQPAALAITTTSPLASYTIGTGPYSATIAASGGIPTYSYTVTGGALPVELTLATNGQISGTPATPGTYDFTVTVTDSTQPIVATVSQTFQLVVIQPAALAITTASPLASYTIGSGLYSATITASGGIPTYTFAVTAGALPIELTLDTAGLLSGTPATPGTYNFTVTVTDSTQPTTVTSSQAFVLDII